VKWLSIYLIPAAVFQSVIFGGAYGTGREVVEYITRFGGLDGMVALAAAGATFGLCLALSFELARSTRSYDYRAFIKQLIGPAWIAFEFIFLIALLLVLAVNISAASILLHDQWAVSELWGRVAIVLMVLALIACGRQFIQRSMAFWSIALLVLLVVYLVAALGSFGEIIGQRMTAQGEALPALGSGLRYALYNLVGLPALVYCARGIETRSQAWIAGLIAGLFAMVPAVLFHWSFLAKTPEILSAPLPTYAVIRELPLAGLLTAYIVVLLAMIVHTITGMLLGFNERIDHWWLEYRGKNPSRWTNMLLSGGLIFVSLAFARFGIVALIARGYEALAWASLVVFALPLLWVSVRRSGRTEPDRPLTPDP